MDTTVDSCRLSSHVFQTLGKVAFRRSETDGKPVMLVLLGEQEAALPLRSLQREFGIEDDSPDGKMLGLIAESLDFVSRLEVGDPLPSEVLSGRASWSPALKHRQTALARLRVQLLGAIEPASMEPGTDAIALERLESDPALRGGVQRAFEQAAATLGLDGPAAVVELVEQVADEMSFIEALRATFLRRVTGMVAKLDNASNGAVMNVDRASALARIRRLAHIAEAQIAGRFVDVDAQTGEVLATLRNVDRQCSFIRSNRDWLYRSSRAWESLLTEWDSAMPGLDEFGWARLTRTYQFLAPRFMPVQEWLTASAQKQMGQQKKSKAEMVW